MSYQDCVAWIFICSYFTQERCTKLEVDKWFLLLSSLLKQNNLASALYVCVPSSDPLPHPKSVRLLEYIHKRNLL